MRCDRLPFSLLGSFLLALVLAMPVRAWEPPRGSPVRIAIFDALRGIAERELGAPVAFTTHTLNVEGRWAFVAATPTRGTGKPIDWSRTRHARSVASGAMGTDLAALLQDTGGGWQVVEFALGAPGAPWQAWAGRYRLSAAFFAGAAAAPVATPAPGAAVPSPPGWRLWPFGALELETPGIWQVVGETPPPLVLGGEPWSVTLSDRPASVERGFLLVIAWGTEEYIYSRGLDGPNIRGRAPVVLGGLAATRTDFSLRDRYNDTQGFDAVTNEPVSGGILSFGCRTPNAMWQAARATCEQVLASLRGGPAAAPTPAPPAPATARPAPPEPVDTRTAAFRQFTAALSALETFEKTQQPDALAKGLEAAEEATRLDATVADYWRTLGYAYALGAKASHLAGVMAENALEKAIELDPSETAARMLLARLLIERDSHSRALDNLEAALERKGDLAASAVIADMCRAYLIDRQAPRGARFLAALAAKHPKAAAIRLGLAVMLNETGRKAEALPLLERIAADPQATQADAEHARALLKDWKG